MGRIAGQASTEIDAPLPDVWTIVADVLRAPDWQVGLDSMRALEHDAEGRPALCETDTDAKVTRVTSRLRFVYDPPHRLAWAQEEGTLKSLEGSWALEDLGGDRTRATYTLDGDPGRALGMLLRGPVEGRMRELLVDALPGELKARVERG